MAPSQILKIWDKVAQLVQADWLRELTNKCIFKIFLSHFETFCCKGFYSTGNRALDLAVQNFRVKPWLSRVPWRWNLVSTCDSVWPGLTRTSPDTKRNSYLETRRLPNVLHKGRNIAQNSGNGISNVFAFLISRTKESWRLNFHDFKAYLKGFIFLLIITFISFFNNSSLLWLQNEAKIREHVWNTKTLL